MGATEERVLAILRQVDCVNAKHSIGVYLSQIIHFVELVLPVLRAHHLQLIFLHMVVPKCIHHPGLTFIRHDGFQWTNPGVFLLDHIATELFVQTSVHDISTWPTIHMTLAIRPILVVKIVTMARKVPQEFRFSI